MPGRLNAFSASDMPIWFQGSIPYCPCEIDGPRAESDVVRNEDTDVKGPVSHVPSVRTKLLLPSVYLTSRAAIKPAPEVPPGVCAGKFLPKTVKTLDDALRVTVNRCAYSQLEIVLGALLSKGGAPMYWPFK